MSPTKLRQSKHSNALTDVMYLWDVMDRLDGTSTFACRITRIAQVNKWKNKIKREHLNTLTKVLRYRKQKLRTPRQIGETRKVNHDAAHQITWSCTTSNYPNTCSGVLNRCFFHNYHSLLFRQLLYRKEDC